MPRLKCAVIGMGKMGMLHYSIANSHPDVEVVAACDTSTLLLRMFQSITDVRTFKDYHELIQEGGLDFAIVAVPTKHHFPIISVLLDADVSVFTEKPLGKTHEEGQELLRKLEGKPHLKGQVGYVNHYQSIFREVKRLIENGYLGDVTSFSMEMYGGVALRDMKESWRSSKDMAGGGCLMEFAAHSVDLANFYFGRPKTVRCSAVRSVYSTDVDDYVHAVFDYEDGMIGWLNSNWSDETYRLPSNIITINGREGKIVAREHQLSVYLRSAKPPYERGWNKRYITDLAEPVRIYIGMDIFTRQLDDFIDAIRNDRPTHNDFRSARDTGWMIGQMYAKAEEGAQAWWRDSSSGTTSSSA
jgi:predicted dehydrogenase